MVKFSYTTIFIIITIFSWISILWANRERYFLPYDHAFFSRIYTNSPYVKGELATEGIGDDGLYAFAGYYYINGGDITQVNFENPPLGKYLIGMSILLFGNQNTINIIYGGLYLRGIFILLRLIFKKPVVAALGTMVVSLDPFFREQLRLSLLDLPLSLFFLFGLISYIKAKSQGTIWYISSAVFFAISFSIKFFPGLFILLGILFLDTFKNDRRHIWQLLLSLVLIPTIYIISHLNYFFFHPSIIDFLKYQKWILTWRLNNPTVLGNIFPNLFFGYYKTWWSPGGWIRDTHWSFILAVLFFLAIFSSFIVRKKGKYFLTIYGFFLTFTCYVGIGTVGVAKYIFPIYPLIIVLALLSVESFLNRRYDLNKL